MISTELRKVLVYLAVWTLIFIGFYLAFWRPSLKRLVKHKEEVDLRQNTLDQLERDIKSYPNTITDENLKKVEDNLGQVFAQIPTKEEIPTILKQIQEYSAQNNSKLIITGMTNMTQEQRKGQSVVTKSGSISKVTYRIEAKGNTRDIIRFLYELESGKRLIAIEGFRLHRSGEEDTYSVDMDTTINIFYSSLESTEASGAGISNAP